MVIILMYLFTIIQIYKLIPVIGEFEEIPAIFYQYSKNYSFYIKYLIGSNLIILH